MSIKKFLCRNCKPRQHVEEVHQSNNKEEFCTDCPDIYHVHKFVPDNLRYLEQKFEEKEK